MIKTAIFVAGFACGCAVGSAMTDQQRQQLASTIGGCVRKVTGAPPARRLGDSVRHVADTAAERAATTIDGLAEAIEPGNGDSGDSARAATSAN